MSSNYHAETTDESMEGSQSQTFPPLPGHAINTHSKRTNDSNPEGGTQILREIRGNHRGALKEKQLNHVINWLVHLLNREGHHDVKEAADLIFVKMIDVNSAQMATSTIYLLDEIYYIREGETPELRNDLLQNFFKNNKPSQGETTLPKFSSSPYLCTDPPDADGVSVPTEFSVASLNHAIGDNSSQELTNELLRNYFKISQNLEETTLPKSSSSRDLCTAPPEEDFLSLPSFPMELDGDDLSLGSFLSSMDLDVFSNNGRTPLYLACGGGHLNLVKLLVKFFNVNGEDENGITPLHAASHGGHLEVVQYLLNYTNADVKVKTNDGRTALHIASFNGCLPVLQYLVQRDFTDVAVKDNYGRTVLHNASVKGHLEIVRYLVRNAKADVDEIDNEGRTPLFFACQEGHLEVVNYLVKDANADVGKIMRGLTILHLASYLWAFEVVQCLLQTAMVDVNVLSIFGHTPLHFACSMGNLEVVQLLVGVYRAIVNVKDNDGTAPLHAASIEGRLEVVKYLLTVKYTDADVIDVEVNNNEGFTPLHFASQEGHLDVVEFLVCNAKANVYAETHTGRMPLHFASQNGHLKVVEFLVRDAKTDPNVSTTDGYTPLHIASQFGHLEVVEYLLTCADMQMLTL